MTPFIIEITNLSHTYKSRPALSGVNFSVSRGEIFGLLGPNGSGKTTLFRILSTVFPPAGGKVLVNGLEISSKIRRMIGVVFQSPSLDGKLTVRENLIHQGRLYGLSGKKLRERTEEMMTRLGVSDRAGEIAGKLSGGLKRRVEIAKSLLHQPELLILDEPSTGLDPGARVELWKYLRGLRENEGVTILVTTHLMEEAEHCGRLAILDCGKLVALGAPEDLKREIRGDVVEVRAREPEALAEKIQKKFQLKIISENGSLQIEHERGSRLVTELVEAFPGEIESVTFRRPSLEDVFLHHTGRKFEGVLK